MGKRRILTISASRLRDFLKCPRYFYFTTVLEIAPKQLVKPLAFGRILHEALDAWRDSGFDKLKALEVIEVRTEEWAKRSALSTTEYDEQLGKLEGMVFGYIDLIAPQLEQWELLASEKKFSVIIKMQGYKLRVEGTIDWIAQKKDTGEKWLFEMKSTSSFDDEQIDALVMHYQPRLYCWYCSQSDDELFKNVVGVQYHLLKKPQIRRRVKSGELHRDFVKRLKACYLEESEKYFKSVPVRINQFLRRNFKQELMHISRDIVQKVEEADKDVFGTWYPNPDSCTLYSKCPYLPLCQYGLKETTLRYYVKEPRKH